MPNESAVLAGTDAMPTYKLAELIAAYGELIEALEHLEVDLNSGGNTSSQSTLG